MKPEIEQLIHDVLHGDATAEDQQRLSDWIAADEANAKAYLRITMDERAIRTNLESAEARSVEQLADSPDDSNAGAMLAELAEIEERSETLDPMALAAEQFPQAPPVSLNNKQVASALSYIFEHAVTPKRLAAVAAVAAAAVLLLGVVLSIVLLTGGEEPTETATIPDFTPVTPTPNPNRVVATVTDQVNAQWLSVNGQGALPDRMLLAMNQRLTLVAGFAEITTNRGAKVLVQAPATIETTDSDNAIRLHRGKLVGICETPSSKGFTVHAPGMDVVDLGTRFGVEADAERGTSVIVMEGSVRAEPTPESPLAFVPVVLERDDARRVEPETGELEAIAVAEAPVFHPDPVHPYVAAVLDNKPVTYWRFEEERGRRVVNEANPGSNDLSMVGPAALTSSGVIGKAGLLTNRGEPYGYFETSNPIGQLAGFEEGTIEFWYYADVRLKQQEGYDAAMLLSLYNATQVIDEPGATSKEMIALELTDDAWLFDQERIKPIGWLEYSIRVYPDFFIENEQRRDIYTDHAHPVQQWQHVVLVKQAEAITLFLDGEPVETMPHTFGPINPLTLRLGRTFDFQFENTDERPNFKTPPRPFLGRLDEVAIYDKPLTAEQVARHYDLANGQESP